jgi:hypothetical protein
MQIRFGKDNISYTTQILKVWYNGLFILQNCQIILKYSTREQYYRSHLEKV